MRVVIDVNIIVSALLAPAGKPADQDELKIKGFKKSPISVTERAMVSQVPRSS